MNHLKTGQFFGQTNKTVHINGITLTDTEYTHDRVEWHYHQNIYFTFILEGNVIEINKKETYHCTPGTLLFHNWQEPHYNIKPGGFTRGFHIEIEPQWLQRLGVSTLDLEGSLIILNPNTKLLFYNLFKETQINDAISLLAIQEILVHVFDGIHKTNKLTKGQSPLWVKKIEALLHEQSAEKLTLDALAKELNLHPVHLCRDFSKYFHCTIGQYIKKLRIEKSMRLFRNKNLSLSDIAYDCGFADQSHYFRCFRQLNGLNPSAFRKLLLN